MHPAPASARKTMKAGETALKKGKGAEALALFQQVLASNPLHVEAIHKVGFILHSAGDMAGACAHYERAIQLDPAYIDSYIMLCYLLDAQKRGEEAVALALHAARIAPGNAEAHVTVASMMLSNRRAHDAVPYLQAVLPSFQNHAELHEFYCLALKVNERQDEAREAYADLRRRFTVSPTFQVIFETYIPRLPRSNEHIDAIRAEFAASLERFIAQKPHVQFGRLTSSVFFLAFHNRDNKALLKRYTQMLRVVAPELNYVAPHAAHPGPRPADAPIRVAYISAHMHKHSVGDCYRGTLMHLAQRADFDTELFQLGHVVDATTHQMAEAGVRITPLPKHMPSVYKRIEAFGPDIIVFPDIGMDITTHFIAMARLAPYQCCLQGHPETTGIDTVDYVISSRSYEPPHGQENYNERLLCNPGIDTIFKRAEPPARWLSRAELGLPEDKKLYICPMAIQKFHPDFDAALAAILARDPQAVLVLFNDVEQQIATDILKERILTRCDPARVKFYDWMPLEHLFSMMRACDAMLDTFYFGAGTTSQYAFGFGIPIVTMPGRYARGRIVHSYYHFMGIDAPPEAATPEDYVELAVRLANDTAYRDALRAEILAKNHRMRDDGEYAPRFAQLLKDILAQDLEKYRR